MMSASRPATSANAQTRGGPDVGRAFRGTAKRLGPPIGSLMSQAFSPRGGWETLSVHPTRPRGGISYRGRRVGLDPARAEKTVTAPATIERVWHRKRALVVGNSGNSRARPPGEVGRSRASACRNA